jgi:hypothetical protein
MIVAIHQPHFLPWLGYLDRMRQADLFILLDDVQFERRNYQNRVRIKTGQGAQWLCVPVVKGSQSDQIVDKLIHDPCTGHHRWGRRAFATLQYAYQGARHFGEFAPAIREIFETRWEKLVDLDWALTELLRDALQIRTPIVRSSELKVPGRKSELILNLCRAVAADVFLGGLGGSRGYLDEGTFAEAGIQVVWQKFTHPRYPQHPRPQEFTPGLSAIDLILNCGPDSPAILRGETASPHARPRPVLPQPGAVERAGELLVEASFGRERAQVFDVPQSTRLV